MNYPVGEDNHISSNAKIHYQIINVNNDEKVLGVIKDESEGLVNKGYTIIGLRDLLSGAYRRRSTKIDPVTSQYIEQKVIEGINCIPHAERIKIYFSVMELEAWILSMYSLLEKTDSRLTAGFIQESLAIPLTTINPESDLFDPCLELKQVFNLVNIDYDKSRKVMESIFKGMDRIDLEKGYENGKCFRLKMFIEEINRQIEQI